MMISKETFDSNWNKGIEDYKKDCTYPFLDLESNNSWSKVADEWGNIIRAGSATNYNAAIAQDEPGDEYSYEMGYFKAFKVICYSAKEDSDSLVMPAMFIARHFIELTLKNLIFNLSIIFGKPMQIGQKNTHDIKKLCDELREIALQYNLTPFADHSFSKIIYQMGDISPKSDEYRYPTKNNGEWNFQDADATHLINLMALNHNMNYFYSLTQSLLLLINDSSDSIYAETAYGNAYIIEFIKIVINSKFKDNKVKDKIKEIIGTHKLPLEKKNMLFKESNDGMEIDYGNEDLFTIVQQEGRFYLKTDGLIE